MKRTYIQPSTHIFMMTPQTLLGNSQSYSTQGHETNGNASEAASRTHEGYWED